MFHDILMIKKIFCESIFASEYELHETDHFPTAYFIYDPNFFTGGHPVFENINRVSGYCNKNGKKVK